MQGLFESKLRRGKAKKLSELQQSENISCIERLFGFEMENLS